MENWRLWERGLGQITNYHIGWWGSIEGKIRLLLLVFSHVPGFMCWGPHSCRQPLLKCSSFTSVQPSSKPNSKYEDIGQSRLLLSYTQLHTDEVEILAVDEYSWVIRRWVNYRMHAANDILQLKKNRELQKWIVAQCDWCHPRLV